MNNPEIWLRYSHSFPIYGLRTCFQSHPLLNMNIEDTIQSRCDNTADVIVAKMVSLYIICYPVFISEVKLKLSCTCAKHGFWKLPKTVSTIDLKRSFKPKPKFGCQRKVSHEPSIVTIFVCMLYDKNVLIDLVTPPMTSVKHMQNETPAPIFLQNIACVAPVLHS